jgi:hypothetical protein
MHRMDFGKVAAVCWIVLAGSAAGAQPVKPLSSHAKAPSSPLATRDISNLPQVPGCTVDPARELFVIDLSAMRDCYRTTWTGPCPAPVAPATRGAWTLGGLLPGLFGTTDPVKLSNLTRQWLGEWKVLKVINGDPVPPRPAIQSLVIDPWQSASGGTTLDLAKAPFRLLAIVFRLDLRRSSGYSHGGTAGEARFIYNMVSANGSDAPFTLILEYGLDAPTCSDIQTWAQAIHALGSIPFGPTYNAALQTITDRFTTIGASPGRPNGSAIRQVRTNEAALEVDPWELREFQLQPGQVPAKKAGKAAAPPPSPAPLLQSTVAQTPASSHNGTQLFADYVNANSAAILVDNYTVPLTYQGQHFRGGASPNNETIWDGPPPDCSSIANAEARHIASLNTCTGCHASESGTAFFRHVFLTGPGGGALLSQFLAGSNTVTDLCGLDHHFGDIERRRVDLCQLLTRSCSEIEGEQPANFVH